MKINWGYRVAILYIGFASLIIYFVYRSMNETVDLVTPDYYAQELKFQDKIESTSRNNNLDQPVTIEYGEQGIQIIFPEEMRDKIEGNILLFRPSDKSKDKNYSIQPGENMQQLIPLSDLEKGMYRVKVEYKSAETTYYTEKQLVVR